jgi:WD40 repeat protein
VRTLHSAHPKHIDPPEVKSNDANSVIRAAQAPPVSGFAFEAYVTACLFDAEGQAAFALGDGSVRFESGARVDAHDGAILCAAAHPSGDGLITGGDDGKVVWTGGGGASPLAEVRGRWIDAVAASPTSGLIAFGAGRELHVRDVADAGFSRVFLHEKSVADVAFEPKGRRLAVATYGGAWLWYARIADQRPLQLRWAGSHILVAFSPDGRFLMSSMQENQLHGWRLSDAKDMRMGGYPAKVKSLAFLAKGALMATAGAPGAVVWPFGGANGPMGKEAAEIGFDEQALVARIAGTPDGTMLAAGLDDGRVWACDLTSRRLEPVKADKGAPISALAVTKDGSRLAFGAEDGEAGVVELPAL